MRKRIYWIVLVQSIVATLGSLYYGRYGDPFYNWYTGSWFDSNNGLTPCQLCWFARILMYPLVIIIGSRIKNKIYDYRSVLILSGLGIIIETYQYRFQMTQSTTKIKSVICGVGEASSCAATDVIYGGFITIPLLCLIAFVIIFVGTLVIQKQQKNHSQCHKNGFSKTKIS